MKSDKPVPQANNKLQAAQTILDRAGVVKTDKLDVNHNVSGGIFILPEKQTIDITAEDGDYEVVQNSGGIDYETFSSIVLPFNSISPISC